MAEPADRATARGTSAKRRAVAAPGAGQLRWRRPRICRTGARPGRRTRAGAPRDPRNGRTAAGRRAPAPARAGGPVRPPSARSGRGAAAAVAGRPARWRAGRLSTCANAIRVGPDGSRSTSQSAPGRVRFAGRRRLVSGPVGQAQQLAVELRQPARVLSVQDHLPQPREDRGVAHPHHLPVRTVRHTCSFRAPRCSLVAGLPAGPPGQPECRDRATSPADPGLAARPAQPAARAWR